jgi:hypothetical protein
VAAEQVSHRGRWLTCSSPTGGRSESQTGIGSTASTGAETKVRRDAPRQARTSATRVDAALVVHGRAASGPGDGRYPGLRGVDACFGRCGPRERERPRGSRSSGAVLFRVGIRRWRTSSARVARCRQRRAHRAQRARTTCKGAGRAEVVVRSLDTAEQALVQLREDAGRECHSGRPRLHKDLRALISNARRDIGKLANALQRDFEQAQKQLAEGTGTAAESRAKASPARRSGAAAKRSAPKAT